MKKEIDWLEEHVAYATSAKELAEINALTDHDERIFRRMELGLERDMDWNEAMYFQMEHNLKILAKKHAAEQKEIDWLEHTVGRIDTNPVFPVCYDMPKNLNS
jgi:hypothetical protein